MYSPASPNYCVCTIWQNITAWILIFSVKWCLTLRPARQMCCSAERQNLHLRRDLWHLIFVEIVWLTFNPCSRTTTLSLDTVTDTKTSCIFVRRISSSPASFREFYTVCCPRWPWWRLVGWTSTSVFSTNTAISKMRLPWWKKERKVIYSSYQMLGDIFWCFQNARKSLRTDALPESHGELTTAPKLTNLSSFQAPPLFAQLTFDNLSLGYDQEQTNRQHKPSTLIVRSITAELSEVMVSDLGDSFYCVACYCGVFQTHRRTLLTGATWWFPCSTFSVRFCLRPYVDAYTAASSMTPTWTAMIISPVVLPAMIVSPVLGQVNALRSLTIA